MGLRVIYTTIPNEQPTAGGRFALINSELVIREMAGTQLLAAFRHR
jgi:hypothetical protein